MLGYALICSLLRAAIGVFFRQVHLVGTEHIPEPGQGPVIFAGNHPNSLIDPVLVMCTSGRIVHFAAKDKLFAWPMGPLLTAVGAVPIARRMDYGAGQQRDNASAFAALEEALARGRCVGIFPEGLSHNRPQLERLRKGAARIALATVATHPEVPLVIVPTGLTYVHRKSFRSRVLVQYGPPIVIDETWVARWKADERAAAQALTDEVELALRGLTINASDWETLRVLDGVRRLYQPPQIRLQQRVELARRFCEVYPKVQHEPSIQAIHHAVSGYLDRLERVGLTDRDLTRTSVLPRGLANLAVLVVWLPLAVPGLVVHLPLLLLIGWAGLRFAPRKDVVGTSRLLLGMVLVAMLYLVLPILTGLWLGPLWAIVMALCLPLTGFATLRVMERGTSLGRLVRTGLAALTVRRAVRELRAEREQLQQQVLDAVSAYLPADMAPLFPDRISR